MLINLGFKPIILHSFIALLRIFITIKKKQKSYLFIYQTLCSNCQFWFSCLFGCSYYFLHLANIRFRCGHFCFCHFCFLRICTVCLCILMSSVAARNDRSRTSAKRSAGHSLYTDQSHSAVRNQELAPFLHDCRQDGQWQNSLLEDLTECPEHHASQRRTWLQPCPCESWGCLKCTNNFKI